MICKFYSETVPTSLSLPLYCFLSYCCLVLIIASFQLFIFSPITSFDLCSPGLSLLISCAFPLLFSCLSCVLFHYLMSSSGVLLINSLLQIHICHLVVRSQLTTNATRLLAQTLVYVGYLTTPAAMPVLLTV